MPLKINRCKLLRHDCNRFGGGLMPYLDQEIPCNFSNNHHIVLHTEIICIEFH